MYQSIPAAGVPVAGSGSDTLSQVYAAGDDTADSIITLDATRGPINIIPVTNGIGLNVGTAEATSQGIYQLGLFYAGTTNLCVRNTTNDVELQVKAFTTIGIMGLSTNHALEIRTNDLAAITVGTSQDVGIGVAASTSYRLLVQKNSPVVARVQAAGSGGIASLEVGSTSTNEAAAISGHANDAAGTLMGIARANLAAFYGRASAVVTAIGTENASGVVVIAPINAEIARFTSTGLRVGNTSATTLLHTITTGSATNADLRCESASVTVDLIAYSGSAASTQFGVNKASGTFLQTAGSGAPLVIGTVGSGNLVLGTNNVERGRFTDTTVTLTGTLIAGDGGSGPVGIGFANNTGMSRGGSSSVAFYCGGVLNNTLDNAGGLTMGQGAIATGATTGHFIFRTMAGTPTGAVADGAFVIDTTGSKLWARVGGAWKGIVIV